MSGQPTPLRARGATSPATTLQSAVRELAAVNAKLAGPAITGRDRLELLRRQAELGDRRDAALDARRRAAIR
jgi:hypothetical protein